MKTSSNTQAEITLAGVAAALRRAAQRAQEIARRTGTPLVTGKDGKVEKRWFKDEPLPAVRDEVVEYKANTPTEENESST